MFNGFRVKTPFKPSLPIKPTTIRVGSFLENSPLLADSLCATYSEKRVSQKKAVVESMGVMECVTESNTCATSRKGITEINIGIASRKGCHGNREACVMESVVVGVMS